MLADGLRELIFGHILGSMLGEEDLSIEIQPDFPDFHSNLFISESGESYRLNVENGNFSLKRANGAIFLGFKSLYYFRGKLRKKDGVNVVGGRIRMIFAAKLIILVWILLMSIWLLAAIFSTMLFTFKDLFFSGGANFEKVLIAGSIIGFGVVVAGCGAGILGLVRWMSVKPKYELKQVCFESMQQRT
ncbi:hypothetical protein ACNQFN_15100 [Thauera butanivorans]|uniref:hypothetical protein n=1 Tax=Thauera butanivorans TaxID=86174 RepID=UPI003AB48C3A